MLTPKRHIIWTLALSMLLPTTQAAGQIVRRHPTKISTVNTKRAATLDERVRAEIAGFKGKVWLHAKNLDTGATYDLGGDTPVRTASTIKVAIMVEAFAQVAAGKRRWSDELILTKEKKVPGAGVLSDLSDGLRLPLRDAVTLMIVLSDNTATNMVLDELTADAVNARMDALGLKETRSLRKISGGGESKAGGEEANKRFGIGKSTPREMVKLLEKLERGEVVNAAVSKEMIELLKRQKYHDGIFRTQWKLPTAGKPGALDALRSDVGIIYSPRGRIVMAITCDDMPEIDWSNDNPAHLLMSRLSQMLIDGLGR
ncbi:MAG: class A beta-lactamase-related serine hydrolase [Acidobacteriota bacterium]|nr:class A beta-lactamase-related serine hydrolase [Acidobacteriota bacterium]